MNVQEDLPKVYCSIHRLLRERLERGKMEPFYRTSAKLKAWMARNGVREISSVLWYEMYYNKTKPMTEGYLGIIYEAKQKKVLTLSRKHFSLPSTRTMRPNPFYFEIPAELAEKALVLGHLP